MLNRISTYYFNSKKALDDALNDETNQNLYFYDGATLQGAPSNCINVPISSFFDYFSTTIYPQVSDLNFDEVDFSDDIKSQIAQSVSQTIDSIKKQKMDILNTFLDTDINISNVNIMLLIFLQYCRDHKDINKDIILKLLKITNFLKENDLTTESINIELSTTILKYLQKDKNIFTIHLYYALKFIQRTPLEDIEKEYFELLSKYDTILEIIQNFKLVKTVFGQDRFKEYIEKFSIALFDDSFFELNILDQKRKIFKLYYLSVLNYDRGKEYIGVYNALYPIFLEAAEKELDELIFYMYTPMLMSWDETAPSQDGLKEFNDKIEKPIENLIKTKLIKKYDLKANTRKIDAKNKTKVAFLVDRVIPYSIYSVFYSLLESLSEIHNDTYEFIIYNLNFAESGSLDSTVQELKELGFKYVDLHKEYVGDEYPFYEIIEKTIKVRSRLIEDNIDILIGFNSRPEYNFLFTTRTAPKQIYWSHGHHMYNVDKIDERISHINKNNDYHYEYFPVKTSDIFLKDASSQVSVEIEKLKELYKTSPIIFGSIGRLQKMNNSGYLSTISTILKKYRDSIYLACGSGNIEDIQKKLNELGVGDRVHFVGHVNPHVYGSLIDIYLNTFPESGGESITEFKHKGKDKLVVSYVNSLENYIDDACFAVQYSTLDIKKIKQLNHKDKVIITSDIPLTKEDSDFIISIVLKNDNIIYLKPYYMHNNNLINYIEESIPSAKVISNTNSTAESIILCDIYTVFYNSLVSEIAIMHKKVLYGDTPDKKAFGSASNDWENAILNKNYMITMQQLFSHEKEFSKAKKDGFKLFSLFCSKAELSKKDQEEYWSYEANGKERILKLFNLAIKYDKFRTLYQEVNYINYYNNRFSKECFADEFIQVLNKTKDKN